MKKAAVPSIFVILIAAISIVFSSCGSDSGGSPPPVLPDPDLDGLITALEIQLGTDPYNADTDGDGLLDGEEDANQNGTVNPGESDPLLADTDGGCDRAGLDCRNT